MRPQDTTMAGRRSPESFWMVWNQYGLPPKFRHDSLPDARKEARRLAQENPGTEFYVLQAIGVAKVMEPDCYQDILELPF